MMVVTHGEDEDPLADKPRDSGADVIEWPKWRTENTPVNEEILQKIGTFEDIFSHRAVRFVNFSKHLLPRKSTSAS